MTILTKRKIFFFSRIFNAVFSWERPNHTFQACSGLKLCLLSLRTLEKFVFANGNWKTEIRVFENELRDN